MVRYCANPVCHAEFWSLHAGILYALERRSMSTEFFWLCSRCAGQMTLGFDRLGNISIRADGGRGKNAAMSGSRSPPSSSSDQYEESAPDPSALNTLHVPVLPPI
jgi:hypothetical protein